MDSELAPVPVQCPHCHKEHQVAIRAAIEAQHRMSMTLEFEDGRFMTATDVGTAIRACGKLIEGVAKTEGHDVAVSISDIKFQPNALRVDYFVAERDAPKDTPIPKGQRDD